jgi:hypothetical protein
MGGKKELLTIMGTLLLMTALASPGSAEPAQARSAMESAQDILGEEDFDYVVIVPTSDQVAALNNLKTWKEQIGFRVKIVTLTEIYNDYPNGDNAERIWSFLHDHYLTWGIRYVLLVGDIDQIPMRHLYPDGNPNNGSSYGTDFYYASLDVEDWDLDNDNRWGEFTEDSLDLHAEVLVGRIPFNDAATIQSIADSIVAFERDIGGWKRNALLTHGFMDIANASRKTDNAVEAEMLLDDVFDPYGWTTTKLYEQSGLVQSAFPTDDLDQANFRGNRSDG